MEFNILAISYLELTAAHNSTD